MRTQPLRCCAPAGSTHIIFPPEWGIQFKKWSAMTRPDTTVAVSAITWMANNCWKASPSNQPFWQRLLITQVTTYQQIIECSEWPTRGGSEVRKQLVPLRKMRSWQLGNCILTLEPLLKKKSANEGTGWIGPTGDVKYLCSVVTVTKRKLSANPQKMLATMRIPRNKDSVTLCDKTEITMQSHPEFINHSANAA